MSYPNAIAADRRLLLLRALSQAHRYTAAARLLRSFLDSLGRPVGADLLQHDLAWLAEMGLIALDQSTACPEPALSLSNGPAEGETIATLLPRGLDVAEGRTVVPGVRRPEPGE